MGNHHEKRKRGHYGDHRLGLGGHNENQEINKHVEQDWNRKEIMRV